MPSSTRPRALLRRHRTSFASWVSLTVFAAALVVFAVNADGYPTHQADLNDGGIWVTNQSLGALGRQNKPVGQIDGVTFDGAAWQPSQGVDVLQNASAVLSVNRDQNTVMPVDVQLSKGLEDQKVSIAGEPHLGGGTVAVVAPDTGGLWVTRVDPARGADSLAAVSADAKPLTKVGGRAAGTVSVEGTAYAASAAEGRLVAIQGTESGFGAPVPQDLARKPEGGIVAMTAVGEHPVLLDEGGRLITSTSGAATVPVTARLQQPGPSRDDVLVATDRELLAVSVSDGHTSTLAEASGVPAAPVRMGECAFGVWAQGTRGTIVTACDDGEPQVADFAVKQGAELVFRVNRNALLLNDTEHGTVWDVDGSAPQEIDDWQNLKQKERKESDDPDTERAANTQPPQAKPDELGARAGRTTVLHVLDNDTCASGGILAIVGIKGEFQPGVSVRIAPDRQTLLADLAPGITGAVSFGYTISDGTAGKTAQADGRVTLQVRGASGVGKPEPRQGFTGHPLYSVASGGTLEIPVTPDWRDREFGDPVVLSGLNADGAETAITPQGLIRLQAPQVAGMAARSVRIAYETSTGGEATGSGSVTVSVLPADGTRPVPPRPEPDVAAGEVGGVISVRPLENDVPGADPIDPGARLELGGAIAPKGGLAVETDRVSGIVTVRPSRPGVFTLDYLAGFGSAERRPAQIRVDVAPAEQSSDEPVPGPDATTVRGTSPATVDVLVNDYDPRGRMLVVQDARPVEPDSGLQVAVIDGRWLRVSASDTAMTPQTQAITYTLSNGDASARGSLTVTQEEPLAPEENGPIAEPDQVTVRVGDTVSIPVLDNDSTPSGDPVGLVLDATVTDSGMSLGELRVLPEVGRAYVSGRRVQYVAPPTVRGPADIQVQYVVENTGDPAAPTSIGTVKVHITPEPTETNPNQPPSPRAIEGRVVQGDVVSLKLPPVGSDPDGDAVSVVAVGSAPKLGRVVSYGANAVLYQAFPGQQGSDQFTFTVADRYGGTAIGNIRIGVVPPGAPQAPVAVNDALLAAPGRTVTVDVLANDLRTPGTTLRILPLEGRDDAELLSDSGPIEIRAGSENGDVVQVPYVATNGIDESRGVLSVRSIDGFNNPPTTDTVYAEPEAQAESVEVDVLEHVYDVDGDEDDLVLKEVSGQGGEIHGGAVTVPVGETAQVLAYRVVDGDGAAAAGEIYVPARRVDTPYLKAGGLIRMQPGKTKKIRLREYVEDPEGERVVLTTTGADALSTAPLGMLDVTAEDETTLELTAGRTSGPAALTFTVSDRAKLGDPDAHTAVLTVPVQIGEPEPVITCPSEPIDVPEGGLSRSVDVAAVCHVWTQDPAQVKRLSFEGDWVKQPAGVSVRSRDRGLTLSTSSDSRAGDVGELAVRAAGAKRSGRLFVRVVKLPSPRLAAIALDGHAGKPTPIDLAGYLSSPLRGENRKVEVISATPANAAANAAIDIDGSLLTLTPKPDTSGVMDFRVEVSDVGRSATSSRPRAMGQVRLAVAARPDRPTGLVAGNDMLSNVVQLTWRAPAANGARIDRYEVKYAGASGSGTFTCAGSPCRVTGLRNGKPYTFTVRAHNVEGWSDPSNSASGTPDDLTGPVLDLRVVKQRDHLVTLAWRPPASCDCSRAERYLVSYPGGGTTPVTGTTFPARVSRNEENLTFTVIPENGKGRGPGASVPGMGAGKPEAPAAPTFTVEDRADNTKGVTIRWSEVGANGPGPVRYIVERAGAGVICNSITATTCQDDLTNNGETYSYTVAAKNAEEDSAREAGSPGHHVSPKSPPGTVEAAATPETPVITSFRANGTDGQAVLAFTAGHSHGSVNTVRCTVNGSSCGVWTGYPPAGGSDTRTITNLPDGSPSTITLQACNGSSGTGTAGDTCSPQSSASQTVTYGPIGEVSLSISKAGGGGVNWSSRVDPNGKALDWRVEYRRNGGAWNLQAQGTTGATGVATPFQNGNQHGNNTTVQYRILVTDTANSSTQDGAARQHPPVESNVVTTDPPPNDPPTISDFIAVVGGCCGAPGQVGVAWTTTYPAGSSGGECHWSRDDVERPEMNPLGCGGNGRASRQFYNQPTGLHKYCGWIRMPDGRTSNVLCQTINVK